METDKIVSFSADNFVNLIRLLSCERSFQQVGLHRDVTASAC
jgi:hypothetical protein